MTKDNTEKKIIKGKIVVTNDRGLHTRPSMEIVKCASSFLSNIMLHYRKKIVNAKSLLGILMLTATKGAKITVEAEGDDAEEAVKTLIQLAKDQFYIKY